MLLIRLDLIESTRIVSPAVNSPGSWFAWVLTSGSADRMHAIRVESYIPSDKSTKVCCHVLRTRKVHVSLFHGSWLPVVRIDSMRIESNCWVPQTNRLSLGVLDMDIFPSRPASRPLMFYSVKNLKPKIQNHWLFSFNNIYFCKCQKADEEKK